MIWLLADQNQAQTLAANGDPNVRTPNLDQIAASGVNLAGTVSGFPRDVSQDGYS
ncbi:MAG: hypothetical protein OHK0021_02430 [Bryobacter sp.]